MWVVRNDPKIPSFGPTPEDRKLTVISAPNTPTTICMLFKYQAITQHHFQFEISPGLSKTSPGISSMQSKLSTITSSNFTWTFSVQNNFLDCATQSHVQPWIAQGQSPLPVCNPLFFGTEMLGHFGLIAPRHHFHGILNKK